MGNVCATGAAEPGLSPQRAMATLDCWEIIEENDNGSYGCVGCCHGGNGTYYCYEHCLDIEHS